MMRTEDILDRLRQNAAAQRAQGVSHAALFGSHARGDASSESDIDIMIEIEPGADIGIFEYAGIVRSITELF